MLERLLIVIFVGLVIVAGWGLLRIWRAAHLRRLSAETPFRDLAPLGQPAIIAFSTPSCTECRSRQQPALKRLAAQLGDAVTIRLISASEHPDLAQRVGVLTVPATAVVDANGIVRCLNLGYANDEHLLAQVRMYA